MAAVLACGKGAVLSHLTAAAHLGLLRYGGATIRMQVFDRRELDSLTARSQGRKGVSALRRLLAELGDEPPELRSHAERALYELVRAAGLPLGQTNVVVAGLTVDAYWPAHNLGVEIDGYAHHHSSEAFENDHERTERLQRAGIGIRRFTAKRVLEHPGATAEALAAALDALRDPTAA